MTAVQRTAWMPMAAPAPFAAVRANPVVLGALYLFVASIPFELPHRALPLEVPTITGFLLLGAALLNPSVCFRRLPAPFLWFVAYLWVFALATWVSGVEQRAEVLRLFIAIAQLVLLFWVIVNLLADPRALRGVLLALTVACVVRAAMQLLGVGATAREVWTGGARVTALGQNANLSAIILAAGLVTVLGLRGRAEGALPRLGLLAWPLAVLLGWAIIQTGSRGGLLCAGAGVAVFLLRGRTVAQRARNALLAVLAIGALAWGAYRSELMRNRFEAAAREGNLAGREKIYPAAIAMAGERPLLGWGPVANQAEIARRVDALEVGQRDAHNLVLELLTTTGLLGTAPFLAGLLLCVTHGVRARHGPAGVLPVAVLAAVLVGTIMGTWIASKILWLALALAAGTPKRSAWPCAV
ncbi:MAG TPA: O-antigen ligase family protein [Gemmatimonadales bacterium]|nr:O-antigen ligase family protein [Gemmatimonadales bacterium]